MRATQRTTLCGEVYSSHDDSNESTVKVIHDRKDGKINPKTTSKSTKPSIKSAKSSSGVDINWLHLLQEVPIDNPIICIGQEFLDAFPVHQFMYTENGWRERLGMHVSSSF